MAQSKGLNVLKRFNFVSFIHINGYVPAKRSRLTVKNAYRLKFNTSVKYHLPKVTFVHGTVRSMPRKI